MTKPRITAAAVLAAHDVLDKNETPENYFRVSSDEQRQMRMAIVRQALIAAHLADTPSTEPTPKDKMAPDKEVNRLCLHLIGLAGRQETAEDVICLVSAEELLRKMSGVAPSARVEPDEVVFASRHNDETGECETVDIESAKVRELRERLAAAKTRRYTPISDDQIRDIMECGEVSTARIKIARLIHNETIGAKPPKNHVAGSGR